MPALPARAMADVHSPAQRSFNMSRIRGKDTRPERTLRSLLHQAGLRFRKHVARLPGKPDIVLPRYKAVVLVHGCYWHRHPGCRFATTPASNGAFWLDKFAGTVERDRVAEAALRKLGWRVFVVWECEIRKNPRAAADILVQQITEA
jgi:DNA mismatch endonuclease (patch repair protein)